ncbi:hypothetical protein TNCV_1206501 [Trichonephila clavipes]|nr:hypothetical protein TNCV_1206501 [Trichonephila clavipes]
MQILCNAEFPVADYVFLSRQLSHQKHIFSDIGTVIILYKNDLLVGTGYQKVTDIDYPLSSQHHIKKEETYLEESQTSNAHYHYHQDRSILT